jgi:mono/diheme cytochrome c family protein
LRATNDDAEEVVTGGVGAADRRCAVVTMVVAASLAVAVSVVVAPRLRAVSPPTYPETSDLVMQGAAVYAAHCAGCHGADLKGGTAQAPEVQPPPLETSGHAWLHSDATLVRMVKYGIANCLGDTTAPAMPLFAEQLDDRSILAVLAFVKSRWSAGVRVVQNAFNDGLSDAAETQEAVLCTAICAPPAPSEPPPPHPHVAAR